MLIHPIKIDQTASSGSWSFNTVPFGGALLAYVLIKAAATSTTFDISITDEDDNVVWEELDVTDEYNDSVSLPLKGIYTIAVANSSVTDSTYTGKLMVED